MRGINITVNKRDKQVSKKTHRQFAEANKFTASVKSKRDDSPPPVINTESVILQNAPHSQYLQAMGRMAFVGLWRSLRKKFEKLKKFNGGIGKHSLGDDCHGLCFCIFNICYWFYDHKMSPTNSN